MTFLQIAMAELGTKEISGTEHNPQVLAYANEAGITGIHTDEVPWCSTFVNWCAHKAKLSKSGKANARSWLSVGTATNHPKPGDIVVFWREAVDSWKGHVGIFLGFTQDASKVHCLGGNQGNAVTIQAYDAGKVLGFRRLENATTLDIPNPTLKRGDKGVRVTKLQHLLNFLGCDCGDPDGDFGGKTEAAMRKFQANHILGIDGIYGNESKILMESLMQS